MSCSKCANKRQPRVVPSRTLYHRRGEWYSDIAAGALCYIAPGALCYIAPGAYEEFVEAEPAVRVPHDAVEPLIKFLNDNGYLKPRLDDRVRTDDVKIINRLIDLLAAEGSQVELRSFREV